jgi:hypothetical protein
MHVISVCTTHIGDCILIVRVVNMIEKHMHSIVKIDSFKSSYQESNLIRSKY